VLWDEYDPMLLQAIAARLRQLPLRAAVVEALVGCIGEVYSTDRERILRRARLLLRHPALMAASAAEQAQLKAALAAMFLRRQARRSAFEAEVCAGAVVAVLECAVTQWVREDGRRPLSKVLRTAFEHLSAF
jgi:hypothetical protein